MATGTQKEHSLDLLNELKKQIGNIHYFAFKDGTTPFQTSIKLIDSPLMRIIEKRLIALEIIIRKNVDIQYITDPYCSLDMYNSMMLLKEWQLTKEEFDLLKEVLCE